MTVLYLILGGVLLLGLGAALYEWRTKRSLLRDDRHRHTSSSAHVESEAIRTEDQFRH